MDKIDYIFLDQHGRKFEGPSGPKCERRGKVNVAKPADAAGVISHLNSPTFRSELETMKAELGLQNYGMDVGRLVPESKEIDGVRVPVSYTREIKLTRSI